MLGSLEVRVDGALVPVPRGKLRVVLATLLLSAGRVVSADHLAETLWGEQVPPSAPVTIRNYVMRLRRALEQAGADRIRTQPPGYVMSVGDQELDVARFEAMLHLAKQAHRSGSWEAAASYAAAALELWRGDPLADVGSEALTVRELPRLTELRLQAIETRADADLRLGRSDEVIAELDRIVASYPFREHLQVLLIRALYCSGRIADALASYQRVRELLVEELGLEPGAELRELHQQVLTGHDPLRTDRAEPAVMPQNRPARHLPAAVRSFLGRQHELGKLMALRSAATGSVMVSVIDGMPGVGKTALAVHVAQQVAGKFPDGQLFIDLHGYTEGRTPRTPHDALDWLLRALHVAPQRIPQDTDERAALYRHCLAGTRTLIVLDNAISAEQLRPLLPGSAECFVLVTSRRRLKGLDDAHTLALDVLAPDDAITLIRVIAGTGLIPHDDPALAEIAELCGQLPLALRITGALLRHRPAWSAEYLAPAA